MGKMEKTILDRGIYKGQEVMVQIGTQDPIYAIVLGGDFEKNTVAVTIEVPAELVEEVGFSVRVYKSTEGKVSE
jgi:hypothetical protein